MQVEYREAYSERLNRMMAFKHYGHAGKVLMLFPTSGGRFYEAEDFGIIDALSLFINTGLIRVITPDSIDAESWLKDGKTAVDKARLHNAYDAYIVEELCPLVRQETRNIDRFMVSGCSMGGYHSANFFFRHPDVFDTLIALSGIYDARIHVGEALHEPDVYFNSPVDYLKNLSDEHYLEAYRNSTIIIACGQGAFEAEVIADTRHLEWILHTKGIPAWVDYWGEDVHHDWVWWRKMMLYYIGKMEEFGVLGTR